MSTTFDYVKYDEIACGKQSEIKAKCVELEALIKAIDAPREAAIAQTELQNVYARCGRAIRDEQVTKRGAELQEQRNNE